LDYLKNKTWSDIASDPKYLALHASDEFFNMTEECFLYFLPGYLLGVVNHKYVFVDRLADSLLEILSARERSESGERLFFYLLDKLTPTQKYTVAHWIQLQLEQDRERRPEVYEDDAIRTLQRIALAEWQKWA
jgi:hypothetical protein